MNEYVQKRVEIKNSKSRIRPSGEPSESAVTRQVFGNRRTITVLSDARREEAGKAQKGGRFKLPAPHAGGALREKQEQGSRTFPSETS